MIKNKYFLDCSILMRLVFISVIFLILAGCIEDDRPIDNWNRLYNYPTGCSEGQAVQVIGDSLTCIDLNSVVSLGDSTFYLHDEASDIAGYESLLTYPSNNPSFDIDCNLVAAADGNVFLSQYITDLNVPSSTNIPAGTWSFATWNQVDNAVNDTYIITNILARTTSGYEYLLFSAISPEIDNTSPTQTTYVWTADTFDLNVTDRLVAKYYAYSTSVVDRNVCIFYENQRATRFTAPLSIDLVHNNLLGLQGCNDENCYHLPDDANNYWHKTNDNYATGTSVIDKRGSVNEHGLDIYSNDVFSALRIIAPNGIELYDPNSGTTYASMFYGNWILGTAISVLANPAYHLIFNNVDSTGIGFFTSTTDTNIIIYGGDTLNIQARVKGNNPVDNNDFVTKQYFENNMSSITDTNVWTEGYDFDQSVATNSDVTFNSVSTLGNDKGFILNDGVDDATSTDTSYSALMVFNSQSNLFGAFSEDGNFIISGKQNAQFPYLSVSSQEYGLSGQTDYNDIIDVYGAGNLGVGLNSDSTDDCIGMADWSTEGSSATENICWKGSYNYFNVSDNIRIADNTDVNFNVGADSALGATGTAGAISIDSDIYGLFYHWLTYRKDYTLTSTIYETIAPQWHINTDNFDVNYFGLWDANNIIAGKSVIAGNDVNGTRLCIKGGDCLTSIPTQVTDTTLDSNASADASWLAKDHTFSGSNTHSGDELFQADVNVSRINGILYVGNGGYSTITAAYNAANNGDTIIVSNGTYSDTLTIQKEITLKSEVQWGANLTGVLTIKSQKVKIQGFLIKPSDGASNPITFAALSYFPASKADYPVVSDNKFDFIPSRFQGQIIAYDVNNVAGIIENNTFDRGSNTIDADGTAIILYGGITPRAEFIIRNNIFDTNTANSWRYGAIRFYVNTVWVANADYNVWVYNNTFLGDEWAINGESQSGTGVAGVHFNVFDNYFNNLAVAGSANNYIYFGMNYFKDGVSKYSGTAPQFDIDFYGNGDVTATNFIASGYTQSGSHRSTAGTTVVTYSANDAAFADDVSANTFRCNTREVTSSGSLASTDCLIDANTVGGTITLTLPACGASNDGQKLEIVKTSASNTLTLNAASGDTICGLSSKSWTSGGGALIARCIDKASGSDSWLCLGDWTGGPTP